MSMRTLEAAILKELQQVSGKKSLKHKDILAWQTGLKDKCPIDLVEGDKPYFLPELGIWAIISEKVTR